MKPLQNNSKRFCYEYIINAGNSLDELRPTYSAPTEEEAISGAKELLSTYKYTEVVFMPCDDLDINEVIWRSNSKEAV